MKDDQYMSLAIEQAKLSLAEGNFPVGALLVIGGEMVGAERNSIKTNADWVSHAETKLLHKHAPHIKKSKKAGGSVTLYTTLEPCLMCFGTAVLNRISRIVFACPDPFTGAVGINLADMPPGYKAMWPELESGLMKDEAHNLVIECMARDPSDKWQEALRLFKNME